MGKVVKGVLLGGLIGAAVAGVKSLQQSPEQQQSEDAAGQVAKTAAGGAAVGGLGLVLRFVIKPLNFAPCSSGVNVPTVTSVVMESAMVR